MPGFFGPPGHGWEYLGDCPEPTPEPSPTATLSSCPYEIPDVERQLSIKAYGQGFDATPKVCAGNAWCLEHTGKDQRCCPPAPEGSDYALVCNTAVLKQACPVWQYSEDGKTWKTCRADPHPVASCDHFDRDDPQTPQYEGTNPICLGDGDPVQTGYWMIPHGKAKIRACSADGVCSKPKDFDH